MSAWSLAIGYHPDSDDTQLPMISLAKETVAAYSRRMDDEGVSEYERPSFLKWVRFYLDFCQTHAQPARDRLSIGPFLAKLASKQQSKSDIDQAETAIELLLRRGKVAQADSSSVAPASGRALIATEKSISNLASAESAVSWEKAYNDLEGVIRLRGYSKKTLEVYLMWLRRFQAFTRSKTLGALDGRDAKEFLTDLAVSHSIAASTQNQAFNALLFFYRHVLSSEFGKMDGVVRAKRRPYVPVVLSRREVEEVLAEVPPPYRLVALLLYGCGLRLGECLELRVQCFNLDLKLLTVHDGKGKKDRTVPLPEKILPEIRLQLEVVRETLRKDMEEGFAGTFLPGQLERKFKSAGRAYIWQWFFPAMTLTKVSGSGIEEKRRYHLHDSYVQMAVRRAAEAARIPKRVSPHTFRHTYASHLLMAGYDLPTIQRLLGHGDVKTTMIYVQTVPMLTAKVAKSPLDMP